MTKKKKREKTERKKSEMVVGSSASIVATIRRESIAGAGIETSVLSFLLVSREGSRATFLRDGKSVERNT